MRSTKLFQQFAGHFLCMLVIVWAPTAAHTQAVSIPIELTPIGLLAHVQVNGQNATLVVDTGATNTVVAKSLVRATQSLRKIPVNTAHGSVTGSVHKGRITLGPSDFDDIILLAVDMNKLCDQVQTDTCIDGFLGLNVLTAKAGTFHIDLRNKQLVLGEVSDHISH